MNTICTTDLEKIANAKYPIEIFGQLDGSQSDMRIALKTKYRSLCREVHPDYNGNSDLSKRAFQSLTDLKNRADKEIDSGNYGGIPTLTITTKQHFYEVRNLVSTSGAANCYQCVIDKSKSGIFTLASEPDNNDLLVNEVKAIQFLQKPDRPEAKGYLTMLPNLIESFDYIENGNKSCAIVYETIPGYVTLSQIIKAYPKGLNPKDMAWIWRRLLDLLGYVHAREVIHGALLPDNILVGTSDIHEVVLTNWQASIGKEIGSKVNIDVIDSNYEEWYPPEVMEKLKSCPGTDLLMSARCMIALMGGNPITGQFQNPVNEQISYFLKSCLITSPNQRPQDAWRLRSEFTKLIDKLWGKREYRPLIMP